MLETGYGDWRCCYKNDSPLLKAVTTDNVTACSLVVTDERRATRASIERAFRLASIYGNVNKTFDIMNRQSQN